jgi:outer membrane protein
MLKTLYWLVAGWLVLCAGAAWGADVRVAFVNSSEVLERAPQAVNARELLQAEFAPRDMQLVAEQQKLRSQEERLMRDGAAMNDDERRRLEREITALQRDVKRTRDEFSEDLNIRRNEEFAKLQREVARVIVEVAKEGGYDMVLENGVVYANERVDITAMVIERLKKSQSSSASRKK